ncbi:MAG TPA: hypothetical protein PKB02_16960 [Anaerohalosphaeraceae bacterium]|nr:hypothetical protein [Anaerohalosphaeraceae bacterium]
MSIERKIKACGTLDLDGRIGMSSKSKAIRCLAASIAGWLIFAGGYVYMDKAPTANEFSFLIHYGYFLYAVIIASMIQLISLACSVIFLLQGIGHKKTLMIAILSAIVYAICICIVFCQHWI